MKTRGFTLIELLVVIAIIGILSSVVLASLTTARSRGTAAAVQNELSNMRAQAELYYSAANKYKASGSDVVAGTGTACTTGQTTNVLGGANGLGALITSVYGKTTSVTCSVTETTWAVAAAFGGTTYCVDSTGKSASSTLTGAVCN